MPQYDTALTTFSPDGNLYQVKYAFEAVRKGKSVVGVRGRNCVVIGVEKPVSAKLQNSYLEKKISLIDKHLISAHAGLSADARVLLDRAKVECQSYKLTVEDKPSVEYVAKWIAQLQQKYTQTGGVRPFGVSVLVAGIDHKNEPILFKTEPTGNYMEWKAAATGQKIEDTQKYLTLNYKEDMDDDESIKLCVETLMEVVESGLSSGLMEIWVLSSKEPENPRVLDDDTINEIRQQVLKQREDERKAREEAARQ